MLTEESDIQDYSYFVGYLPLWQEWARQNPELIEELRTKSAGKTLTDQFANTRVNQARALADILNSTNIIPKEPQSTSEKQENQLLKGVRKLMSGKMQQICYIR